MRLNLPICQPSKSSEHTLSSSGSVFGLAPFNALSQLTTLSLLDQLASQGLIKNKIWSLTLLDSITGILSLGGTIARDVEQIKIDSEVRLKHLSDLNRPREEAIEEEVQRRLNFMIPPLSTFDEHYKWTHPLDNGAARGWWQTLMTGVWINGVKILKNQPVVLDVNCPVILAPRHAARHVYANIGAGIALQAPRMSQAAWSQASDKTGYDGTQSERFSQDEDTEFDFYAYPCLNPPSIVFELAGWPFPVMQGPGSADDALNGLHGGLFSMGKVDTNDSNVDTGYCVGKIVGKDFQQRGIWASVGLRDTWVLGEPFFRGIGVVGDLGDALAKNVRIGVRKF